MAEQHSDISWSRDFESSLARAAAEGRHLLLDFSAAPM
jgi:hypothetical protein